MRAYLIRRLLLIIPALFMLTILVFLAARFIPGDAVDYLVTRLGPQAGGRVDEEALRRMLGLDVPVYVQYGRWMGDIFLHGTFGESLIGGWSIEREDLR